MIRLVALLIVLVLPVSGAIAENAEGAQTMAWRPVAKEDIYLGEKPLEGSVFNSVWSGAEDSVWLTLAPGAGLTTWVPASHWLAVIGQTPLAADSISLQGSDTPGLFYSVVGRFSEDASRLLVPPVGQRLVSVTNVSARALQLGLQLGAMPKGSASLLRYLPGYRPLSTTRGSGPLALSEQPGGHKLPLLQLVANEHIEYKVNGPSLLTISSIVPGPSVASGPVRWHIDARLNERKLATWGHREKIGNRHFYKAAEQQFWATSPGQYYLQIPPGAHVLSLRADRTLWLSVGDSFDGFLFEQNKRFLATSSDTAVDLTMQDKRQLAYSLLTTRAWVDDPGVGVDRLRAVLGDKASIETIDDLGGTSYRAIYPDSSSGLKAINLDFLARHWQKPGPVKPDFVDAQAQALVYPTPRSILFFELSKRAALRFKLPGDRVLPSVKVRLYNPHKLRGKIAVGGARPAMELSLEPQDLSAWPNQYSLGAALPYLQVAGGQAMAGKKLLAQDPAIQSEMIFDLDSVGDELVFSTGNDDPVYIALSVSTPILPGIDEKMWLELFDDESKLDWLNADIQALVPGVREEMLQLRELLNLRAQQFTKTLNVQGKAPVDSESDQTWLAQAKALKVAGRVGELAELVFIEHSGSSLALWQWRLELLRNNGLWGNYVRVLKALSSENKGGSVPDHISEYARQALTEYLSVTDNSLGLERLSSHLVLTRLDPAALYLFAEKRFEAGDYSSTLRALALLPQADQSAQLGLWTALQLNHWELYEHLLQFLDDGNSDFYRQLKLSFAGEQGQVSNSTPLSVLANVGPSHFPGVAIPNTARPSRLTLISAPGLVNAWNPSRRRFVRYYDARPGQAVQGTISGPAELILNARQLRALGSDSDDDWLTIKIDQQDYLLPINGNYSVSGLVLKDSDSLLGARHSIKFKLGAGDHQISVKPQYSPVAIDISLKTSPVPDAVSATGVSTHSTENCQALGQWYLVDGAKTSELCLPGLGMTSQSVDAGAIDLLSGNRELQALNQQVRQWELDGKADNPMLQDIAAALLGHADDWRYRHLKQRMGKYYGFELLNPTQSAGRRRLEAPVLPIESPVARLLAAVKGYDAGQGTLYRPGEKVHFALELPKPVKVRIIVRRYTGAFSYAPSTHITIHQDGEALLTQAFDELMTSNIALSLTRGDHDLSVSFDNPNFDQLFSVDLMIADGQGGWQRATGASQRRLNTASQSNPLQYYLPQASLLRIDEYSHKNKVRSYYEMHDQAGFYTPRASDKESLAFRVFKLKRRDKKRLVAYLPEAVEPAAAQTVSMLQSSLTSDDYQGLVDSLGDSLDESVGTSFVGNETQTSEALRDFTLGFYYRGQSRLNFDEDSRADKERFHEIGQQQRDYDETTGRYRRLDMFGRVHESGHMVLGARSFMDWAGKRDNQVWYSNMSAHYQFAEGSQSSAWSARLALGWRQNSRWANNLRNQLNLSGFYQRVADLGRGREYWDNDVYSTYKKDHKNGLRVNNILRYRPFNDVELFSGFSARSNTLNEHFDADSASLSFGAQAYLRGSVLKGSVRRYRFFADDDRGEQDNKNVWTLALGHNLWRSQGAHWRLKAKWAYDQSTSLSTVDLGVYWNDTQGRGLDDFRLNEFAFRDVYRQQADQEMSVGDPEPQQ